MYHFSKQLDNIFLSTCIVWPFSTKWTVNKLLTLFGLCRHCVIRHHFAPESSLLTISVWLLILATGYLAGSGTEQRRSHDFFLGGPPGPFFRHLRKPTRFSGGGAVADVFRDLHERTRSPYADQIQWPPCPLPWIRHWYWSLNGARCGLAYVWIEWVELSIDCVNIPSITVLKLVSDLSSKPGMLPIDAFVHAELVRSLKKCVDISWRIVLSCQWRHMINAGLSGFKETDNSDWLIYTMF